MRSRSRVQPWRQGSRRCRLRRWRAPSSTSVCLVDHRERLVGTRVALNSTLQCNLHDLWPELTLPGGALFSKKWTTKIGRRLARAEQTMRVRIARDELRRLRELTETINALEVELGELVARVAPQLIAEPGCGR